MIGNGSTFTSTWAPSARIIAKCKAIVVHTHVCVQLCTSYATSCLRLHWAFAKSCDCLQPISISHITLHMTFHDNVARHLVEDEPDNSMPAVCWQTPPRAARALPETPMPVERTRQRYTCDNIQHIAFGPAKPSVMVSTPDASTLVAARATIVPAWATLQKAVAMSNDWQQQQYQRLLPTPALLMPEHALSSRRMQIQCAGYELPLLPVTRNS